jgi:hypothetical protein
VKRLEKRALPTLTLPLALRLSKSILLNNSSTDLKIELLGP